MKKKYMKPELEGMFIARGAACSSGTVATPDSCSSGNIADPDCYVGSDAYVCAPGTSADGTNGCNQGGTARHGCLDGSTAGDMLCTEGTSVMPTGA